jgi:hypothetical protein
MHPQENKKENTWSMKYIWQCNKRYYRWFHKCLFLFCLWCMFCIIYWIDSLNEVSCSRYRKTNVCLHTMWQKILFTRYFRTSCENTCYKAEKFENCKEIYKNKNMLAFRRLTYGTTDLYLCQYCERFAFSSFLGLHLIGDHRDIYLFLSGN